MGTCWGRQTQPISWASPTSHHKYKHALWWSDNLAWCNKTKSCHSLGRDTRHSVKTTLLPSTLTVRAMWQHCRKQYIKKSCFGLHQVTAFKATLGLKWLSSFFQTRMQSLQPEPNAQYRGVYEALKRIIQTEGIFRPLRGLNITMMGAGPAHALYFACYERVKRSLSDIIQSGGNSHLANGTISYFPTRMSLLSHRPLSRWAKQHGLGVCRWDQHILFLVARLKAYSKHVIANWWFTLTLAKTTQITDFLCLNGTVLPYHESVSFGDISCWDFCLDLIELYCTCLAPTNTFQKLSSNSRISRKTLFLKTFNRPCCWQFHRVTIFFLHCITIHKAMIQAHAYNCSLKCLI